MGNVSVKYKREHRPRLTGQCFCCRPDVILCKAKDVDILLDFIPLFTISIWVSLALLASMAHLPWRR